MKKFTDLVSKDIVSSFEASAREAKKNDAWLERSFEIALLVLVRLKELKWNQAQLAEAMKVSPQYVSKILKGRENLTLETIAQIEKVLDFKLINVNSKSIPTIVIQSSLPAHFSDIFAGIALKIENNVEPREQYSAMKDGNWDKNLICAA